MEDKQFIPVSPTQPAVPQAPVEMSESIPPVTVQAEALPTIQGNSIAQKQPNFTKRLESAKKLRKIMFKVTLAGAVIIILIFAFGMTSQDAEIVNTMQGIVGFAAIPLAIIAGLWFAQAARVAVNSYQEGTAEADSNKTARTSWYKRLKISTFVILGGMIVSITSSLLSTLLFGSSMNSSSELTVFSSVIPGVIQLGGFVAFIVFIIGVVKLSKGRAKVLTRQPPHQAVHWVLRAFICTVAFLSATGPVAIIVGFMALQLYSHWCNLTSSKCY